VNKYKMLLEELETVGSGSMKCFGNSMLPILSNPSVCFYEVRDQYNIDDIVFSKVNGRYIDAHKITAVDGDRYLISNNKGHNNGWTRTVYGKVVKALDKHGNKKEF
jgi:hypothetical protein